MKKLCETCKVIYQNADADVSQLAAIQLGDLTGAKVIVLDPVDFDGRGRRW